MVLAHPLLLGALLLLPVVWLLLRMTPPAPRTQDFPAIRLLLGIEKHEETPRRTPPPLLLLRLLAATALLLGLVGPTIAGRPPAGHEHGPVLLVIDDGWASAHDWSRRMAAADRILADAAATDRPAALLATARDDDDAPPAFTAAMPATLLRTRLAALAPHPWPVDRDGAARALRAARGDGGYGGATLDYLADGVATPDDAAFARALRRFPRRREYRDRNNGARLLALAPERGRDALAVVLTGTLPPPSGRREAALDLLAENASGGALARVPFGPARRTNTGAYARRAAIRLPLEIRNGLTRLAVADAHAAGDAVLLDDGDRAHPVGLLNGDAGSDTPLLGSLYYVRRAFGPDDAVREGSLASLLARPLSVLVATDGALADPADRARVAGWVRGGGTLIRFAGPHLAAIDDGAAAGPEADASAGAGGDAPGTVANGATASDRTGDGAADGTGNGDPLLPVALLPGARALGGAMSWGHPQHLAPFPDGSPFKGLAVPAEVTVTRQVLARPSVDLARRSWATLRDGTPVVTARRLGNGRVVLFHVTANADWSNLPLSGLFVGMLGRLDRLAAGIPAPGDTTILAPVDTVDGFGVAGPPPPGATGIAADAFGRVPASPRHPPGVYGRGAERRSLNLADAAVPLAVEADTGNERSLERPGTVLALGPWLIGLALALLALDLLLSLGGRGLLRRPVAATVGAVLIAAGGAGALVGAGSAPACAEPANPSGNAAGGPAASGAGNGNGAAVPEAALQTELAYVVTGDADVDRLSRDGLAALSDYVNARTAATLGPPAAVSPGRDDLSFYPLLYWPVLPDTALDRRGNAALDGYMRTGGILVIDTEGGDADGAGSGAGFAPGVGAALRRVTVGLDVPPLVRLDARNVLAHTFYLLRDFPGRFAGAPVWVDGTPDPSNDGVSPVILGANDWAAAWAVGADGQKEVAILPGGDGQRTLAYRFGVNLVMYALTGSYKADQVHVPAILQRLGPDNGADEGE